jgi:CHAD domain-containing protein
MPPHERSGTIPCKGGQCGERKVKAWRAAAQYPGRVPEVLERELKLTVDGDFQLPDLGGAELDPRLFTSTYYDTSDHRLLGAGITLRRRVEQGKGVWQLKLPRGPARLEIERQGGPSGAPRELGDLLVALVRGRPLQPVAKLRTRRSSFRLQEDGTPAAQIALDHVDVLDGRRRAWSFAEVGVELLQDRQDVLDDVERALRAAGVRNHDGRTKLARALRVPAPAPVEAQPDAPTGDHLRAMIARQYAALLAHDPGARLGDDPEDVHLLRVATRRLRSVLRVARPVLDLTWAEPLRAELAWLGGELGPVRDLDVLIDELERDAGALEPAERRAFARLLKRLDQEREEARNRLLVAMGSARYLMLLDSVEDAARDPRLQPAEVTVAELAAGEFRRLRRAARKLDPDADDTELHALRIRGKRARYAAELAEAAIGRPATRFVARAKTLQDVIGSHQDAIVAEQSLRRLVAEGSGRQAAFAAGRLVERARGRKEAARSAVPGALAKLERSGRRAFA